MLPVGLVEALEAHRLWGVYSRVSGVQKRVNGRDTPVGSARLSRTAAISGIWHLLRQRHKWLSARPASRALRVHETVVSRVVALA